MPSTPNPWIWMNALAPRIFRAIIFCGPSGVLSTPHEYLTRKRIERAKELLAQSQFTVTEICFEVGFESLGSFSALFHRTVGWSPSIYRARAWEMNKNPLKFIPNCYVIMHGIQVSNRQE